MTATLPDVLADRHASTRHLMQMLAPTNDLSDNEFQIQQDTFDYGIRMCYFTNDGPELMAALRKLIEVGDCLRRQSRVDASIVQAHTPPSGRRIRPGGP